MSQKVFLHIGLPKTGTTYLQGGLWEQRDQLAAAGLLLPGSGHRHHLLASLDIRHDPKLAKRSGVEGSPWRDLVREILAWPGDALVTHEFLGAASTEHVEAVVAALPGREVHVILTARDSYSLVLSRWQEWIKNGATERLANYPKRTANDPWDEWGWSAFDLERILQRWSRHIPAEHVHVLPLHRGAPVEELWDRFVAVLGLDSQRFQAPQLAANQSLGVVQTELLRRVNRHLGDFRSAADRGRWIRGYLGESGVLAGPRERYRMAADRAAEYVAHSERVIAALGQGYDVRGRVQDLASTFNPDHRLPGQVEEAELLEVAVRTIALMMEDLRTVTLERDSLQAQVVELRAGSARRLIRRIRRGVAR